ncbi:MAG: carbon-nitrogen hydrolase family protein [Sulfurovum sp.]|nr:carbon-nitrogen hydrolase family protein [Sulfurovum sp.]
MKGLTIAALQLPTLGMNATRLEFYLKKAKERESEIILFGEYVLNHFFKELEKMSRNMVKEQTRKHLKMLEELAKSYDMTFIVPIVLVKKKQYYKTIAKITPKKTDFYIQQILIPYEHWDEVDFFDNEVKPLHKPMIFRHKGFKIAVMGGYELHFDPLWDAVRRKKVDIVLLPTASTFGSHDRWRELIKSRAFLYGCYVLRANRLGEYVDGKTKWRFYGDSMLVSPEGEIEMMLEDKESMLIENISKQAVKEHRNSWKFLHEINRREELP